MMYYEKATLLACSKAGTVMPIQRCASNGQLTGSAAIAAACIPHAQDAVNQVQQQNLGFNDAEASALLEGWLEGLLEGEQVRMATVGSGVGSGRGKWGCVPGSMVSPNWPR